MEAQLAAEGAEEFALVRDFAIIMLVAGGVVVLFRKLKQPPILGYLLAGLIIGPFTLPNPPVQNVETIRLLADLGLVLLLYALGLELGWRRIREVGLGVLVIGTLEILGMMSLGYLLGQLLGWTDQESLFLGAALSISSSAILFKVLRDTGQLSSTAGRLIVGILVVEDFAAVILLTLLSGLAATGTAEAGEAGALVLKLAIFALAALALGAVFVPRILRFINQFESRETTLLVSLALCFALALLGQSLGMSAAAGAFIVGAVVGDTDEAHQIAGIVEPIRDMFGALFFVSIGMLIDINLIKDNWIPVLVVSAVFMAGKIVGNTVGTFITGRSGRTPIQVGMGMPQIGEFSLAMMKVGVEHQAIGSFMYTVIAGVTAITSLIYPYLARSADAVAGLLERRTPAFAQNSLAALSSGLRSRPTKLAFDDVAAQRIRAAGIPVVINLLIIVVLLGVGAYTIGFASNLAQLLTLSEELLGRAIGLATIILCVPSALGLWRGLRHLSDETAFYLARFRPLRDFVLGTLSQIVRDAALILALLFVGIWGLPLLAELLSLGYLAAPVPLLVLVALALMALRILARMQHQLLDVFSNTFLGLDGGPESTGSVGVRALVPRRLAIALKTPGTGRDLALRLGIAVGIIAVLAAGWVVGYLLTSGTVWWFL